MMIHSVTLFQELSGGSVNSGLLYVIAAYAVLWIFIFGYLYSLNRRHAALHREIELMKQEEAEQREQKVGRFEQ